MSLLGALLASAGGAYPKVEWVGGATSQNSGSHTWAFGTNAIPGAMPGDLLLLQVFGPTAEATSGPAQSGWTALLNVSDGTGVRRLYYKVIGEGGLEAVSGSGSFFSGAALMCFRNAQYVSHSTSASATLTTPSILMDRGDMSVALFYAKGEAVWTNSSAPIAGYTDWAQYANYWSSMIFVSKGAMCFRPIRSDGATTGGSWLGGIPAANFMACVNVRLSPLEDS